MDILGVRAYYRIADLAHGRESEDPSK
jgi:hypothetical protein